MLLNCGIGEDSWESLGQQGDPIGQSWRKSTLNIHWKDWCWSWLKLKLQYFGHLMWRTGFLEKTLMLERLKAGVEGYDRGWDGWMASPTPWTWVWESSETWWWTGKPGLLESMGSQRVEHNWVTKLNWIDFQYIWWINLVFLKPVSLQTLSPDYPFIERGILVSQYDCGY